MFLELKFLPKVLPKYMTKTLKVMRLLKKIWLLFKHMDCLSYVIENPNFNCLNRKKLFNFVTFKELLKKNLCKYFISFNRSNVSTRLKSSANSRFITTKLKAFNNAT